MSAQQRNKKQKTRDTTPNEEVESTTSTNNGPNFPATEQLLREVISTVRQTNTQVNGQHLELAQIQERLAFIETNVQAILVSIQVINEAQADALAQTEEKGLNKEQKVIIIYLFCLLFALLTKLHP